MLTVQKDAPLRSRYPLPHCSSLATLFSCADDHPAALTKLHVITPHVLPAYRAPVQIASLPHPTYCDVPFPPIQTAGAIADPLPPLIHCAPWPIAAHSH
jgi:hypothetical protein